MLIDGRAIAHDIKEALKIEVTEHKKRVTFIAFGNNSISKSYIDIKEKAAQEIGVATETLKSMADATASAMKKVEEVIASGTDGIIVQLPLPGGIDVEEITRAIPTALDIDVINPISRKEFIEDRSERMPPVAAAVKEILSRHMIDLFGKNVVVLGKGRLVGAPVCMYLDKVGVPYQVFDSESKENSKRQALKEADIIVSGIGKPHYIRPEMIKAGAIILDAGTSESDGRIMGDVDPLCSEEAALMTPVPGGIGPIAVACLFRNLYLR